MSLPIHEADAFNTVTNSISQINAQLEKRVLIQNLLSVSVAINLVMLLVFLVSQVFIDFIHQGDSDSIAQTIILTLCIFVELLGLTQIQLLNTKRLVIQMIIVAATEIAIISLASYENFFEETHKTNKWLLIIASVCSFIFIINTICKIIMICLLNKIINDEIGHNIIQAGKSSQIQYRLLSDSLMESSDTHTIANRITINPE